MRLLLYVHAGPCDSYFMSFAGGWAGSACFTRSYCLMRQLGPYATRRGTRLSGLIQLLQSGSGGVTVGSEEYCCLARRVFPVRRESQQKLDIICSQPGKVKLRIKIDLLSNSELISWWKFWLTSLLALLAPLWELLLKHKRSKVVALYVYTFLIKLHKLYIFSYTNCRIFKGYLDDKFGCLILPKAIHTFLWWCRFAYKNDQLDIQLIGCLSCHKRSSYLPDDSYPSSQSILYAFNYQILWTSRLCRHKPEYALISKFIFWITSNS